MHSDQTKGWFGAESELVTKKNGGLLFPKYKNKNKWVEQSMWRTTESAWSV